MLIFGRMGMIALALCITAQALAGQTTAELEEWLYVLKPHMPAEHKGVTLEWIPEPLQGYCLGKTPEQCHAMDFCIRTTSPGIAMCRNLVVPLSRLPAYPREMRPRRVLSITFMFGSTIPGFDALLKYVQSTPEERLNHFSSEARVKARIRLTRSAADDQFQLLEVLAVPGG
jgi:hypothetical protein